MDLLSPTISIDGFDPLAADDGSSGAAMATVFEEASKRIVHNILKSYTGYFDVFSEVLQNALDAVELKLGREGATSYKPKLWIFVDIPNGRVHVIDNGVGLDEQQFKYCLRPSVSFKQQANLRGHKGVGATFLAYGFSFLKASKQAAGRKSCGSIKTRPAMGRRYKSNCAAPSVRSYPVRCSRIGRRIFRNGG